MKAKASTVINKRVTASAKASMNFEGLKPSKYAQKVGEHYLKGNISSQDAITKIRAKHISKVGR